MQLEQFVAHTLQTALSADSMANTHPISVPVKNPSQITEIFDSISYDKVRSSAAALKTMGICLCLTEIVFGLVSFSYTCRRGEGLVKSIIKAFRS